MIDPVNQAMAFNPVFIFPAVVLMVAALLLWLEVRSWRGAACRETPGKERDHRRRRFRRRMQAGGMLAVVAGLMFAGLLVEPMRYPSSYVWIWVAVFVLVVWLILLALADAAVSLLRGHQAAQDLLEEQAKLEAALRSKSRRPKSPP